MGKEKESDSNLSTQIGTEVFEDSVERTEDVDVKAEAATIAPVEETAPPNTSEVPEYVYPAFYSHLLNPHPLFSYVSM